MGTYLATGIIQKIAVSKKEIERNTHLNLEGLKAALSKELKLQHYNFSENEQYFLWTINPRLLEGNLSEFLEEQFKMYGEETAKRDDIQKLITSIKQIDTGEKIIELAENHNFVNLQMVNYAWESIKVKHHDSNFDDHVTVNYNMIAFFIDGKIIMECYKNIFRYFENNIRKQEKIYPIAACVKTMIVG